MRLVQVLAEGLSVSMRGDPDVAPLSIANPTFLFQHQDKSGRTSYATFRSRSIEVVSSDSNPNAGNNLPSSASALRDGVLSWPR